MRYFTIIYLIGVLVFTTFVYNSDDKPVMTRESFGVAGLIMVWPAVVFAGIVNPKIFKEIKSES